MEILASCKKEEKFEFETRPDLECTITESFRKEVFDNPSVCACVFMFACVCVCVWVDVCLSEFADAVDA